MRRPEVEGSTSSAAPRSLAAWPARLASRPGTAYPSAPRTPKSNVLVRLWQPACILCGAQRASGRIKAAERLVFAGARRETRPAAAQYLPERARRETRRAAAHSCVVVPPAAEIFSAAQAEKACA